MNKAKSKTELQEVTSHPETVKFKRSPGSLVIPDYQTYLKSVIMNREKHRISTSRSFNEASTPVVDEDFDEAIEYVELGEGMYFPELPSNTPTAISYEEVRSDITKLYINIDTFAVRYDDRPGQYKDLIFSQWGKMDQPISGGWPERVRRRWLHCVERTEPLALRQLDIRLCRKANECLLYLLGLDIKLENFDQDFPALARHITEDEYDVVSKNLASLLLISAGTESLISSEDPSAYIEDDIGGGCEINLVINIPHTSRELGLHVISRRPVLLDQMNFGKMANNISKFLSDPKKEDITIFTNSFILQTADESFRIWKSLISNPFTKDFIIHKLTKPLV